MSPVGAHGGAHKRRRTAVACLIAVTAGLSACTGGGGKAHTIHWISDVRYSFDDLGALGVSTTDATCDSSRNIRITVYDENNKAVSGATSISVERQVDKSGLRLTCRFVGDIKVDDAKRYRAERPSGDNEAYSGTVHYDYVDASELKAKGWVWDHS